MKFLNPEGTYRKLHVLYELIYIPLLDVCDVYMAIQATIGFEHYRG